MQKNALTLHQQLQEIKKMDKAMRTRTTLGHGTVNGCAL